TCWITSTMVSRSSSASNENLLRRAQASRGLQLTFADHVHELNATKGHGGRPERLEPHHRSHLTLDRSMVLFDDVVEVLDLPELNLCVLLEVVARDRRGVGPTLVDGNLRRHTILADRLAP